MSFAHIGAAISMHRIDLSSLPSFMFSLFQQQNKEVARKLGTATALMFTLPLIVFYVCTYLIFTSKEEPMMWGGFASVLTVNVVIAGYVLAAFSEEDDTTAPGDENGPRVGAFKMRTD